jgi:hypothetical protein
LTALFLLFPSVLLFSADVQPANASNDPRYNDFWLNHALDEAKAVEDPLLQAEAYSKAAVLKARMGDVRVTARLWTLPGKRWGVQRRSRRSHPLMMLSI